MIRIGMLLTVLLGLAGCVQNGFTDSVDQALRMPCFDCKTPAK